MEARKELPDEVTRVGGGGGGRGGVGSCALSFVLVDVGPADERLPRTHNNFYLARGKGRKGGGKRKCPWRYYPGAGSPREQLTRPFHASKSISNFLIRILSECARVWCFEGVGFLPIMMGKEFGGGILHGSRGWKLIVERCFKKVRNWKLRGNEVDQFAVIVCEIL